MAKKARRKKPLSISDLLAQMAKTPFPQDVDEDKSGWHDTNQRILQAQWGQRAVFPKPPETGGDGPETVELLREIRDKLATGSAKPKGKKPTGHSPKTIERYGRWLDMEELEGLSHDAIAVRESKGRKKPYSRSAITLGINIAHKLREKTPPG